MISPYHEIISSDDLDFEDLLKRIHLIHIFEPVLTEFQDPDLFRGVVKFIAWGYSLNSDMLHSAGNTWKKVSDSVFEKTGLPRGQEDEIYKSVCELGSDAVRESIERWLRFQNDENWNQYVHFRDLRRQMFAYSLKALQKSGGEIDVDAKMKAAEYSLKLLGMMEDAKETFIQNNPKLKSSVEAVNKVNKDKLSRSPGSYAL